MPTPTITTIGTLNNLLLITDHEGVAHRVPKNSVAEVQNSSNADVYRIEVAHARGTIILIFDSAVEVTAILSAIDAEY